MKHTYLITGGAGFIGCNAAAYFLAQGHDVIVFDNFSRRGTEDNAKWLATLPNAGHLTVVRGDTTVADNPALAPLVERADFVLHFAAQVAVTTSVEDPRTDFMTNAFGTFNVLEAIRKSAKRPALIYSSTNKVYGGLDDVRVKSLARRYAFRDIAGVDERQPLDFHSPYGCSKGAADQYVRDYSRIYGLRTVVCRQSCIYGPRQFGIEDQGWVAWFIIATLTGKPITIYGNGKQVRDLLYVDDLIRCYDLAFTHMDRVAGSIFNIGGGPKHTLSLLEFLEILEAKKGSAVAYAKGAVRPGDQPIYVSDIRLASRKLGWKPEVGVREGIDKLWKWAEEHRRLFRA